jgi:biopolymer transport protein ExbD
MNLPRVVTSQAVRSENIEIIITAESTVFVNGKSSETREIKKLLKQAENSKKAVLIKADKRASLGKVAEILDIARDSGVLQINIATNQE